MNLPLQSFCFVDDNPVECAMVRSELPFVAVTPPSAALHFSAFPRRVSLSTLSDSISAAGCSDAIAR
eukprot:2030203-Rhodomonas_salina.3